MELGFLNPLFDRPGPWASVYFDTSLATEDALTRHELGARAACDRLAALGADERTRRAVFEALSSLPRTTHPPGRAVFATDGEVVLDPVLTTPPPGGMQVSFSPLPHTAPLLDLADAEPTCLVAYIDRTGADLELRGPTGVRHAGRVDGVRWPVHQTGSVSWSERHAQNEVENNWERNAATVAEALGARHQETGAELLVLAGDPRQRRAVHDRLPAALLDAAIETEHGGRAPGSDRHLLDEELAEARATHARQRMTRMMERFCASRVPSDDGQVGAAEGVPALIDAAREHRIAALLVRPDGPEVHREVWVGHDPDQLAVRRHETRYLGDPEPVPARADDALLRSAAATGAEVLTVRPIPGTPPGLPVGGLGALLRWPYAGREPASTSEAAPPPPSGRR